MSTSFAKLALSTMTALAFAVAPVAGAQTINLTGADAPTSGFGKGGSATYGQTFIAPTGFTNLQSFSFWLSNDPGLTTNPASLLFKAYIMPWDAVNGHATGSALYTSSVRNGPTVLSQRYDFATSGIALNASTQYVAFLSVSGLFASIVNTEALAVMESTIAGNYTGGQFVFADNGNDLGALTTDQWALSGDFPEYQTHFNATFTAASTVVPEPSSLVLFASSGALLVMAAFKRRRA